MRYVCLVEYDGTNYVGFQIQPNGPSIQQELERVLTIIAKLPAGEKIAVHSSGRTDAGVHAYGQVIHFDFPFDLPAIGLLKAMNTLIDPAIRIVCVNQAAPDFHSRYDAIEKTYHYHVNLESVPNPFRRLYTLHHPYPVDLERLQPALDPLVGRHDFTSFCSMKTDKVNLVRTVDEARVEYDEGANECCFIFRGEGFLHHMLRIIVGTTLQIGNGLKSVDELERLLAVRDRRQAGPTAGPSGLFLMSVKYPEDPFSGGAYYDDRY